MLLISQSEVIHVIEREAFHFQQPHLHAQDSPHTKGPKSIALSHACSNRSWPGFIEGKEEPLTDDEHPFRSSEPWASFAEQGKDAFCGLPACIHSNLPVKWQLARETHATGFEYSSQNEEHAICTHPCRPPNNNKLM